jgi:Ni,Fe-hydrogenase I large subunit
MARISIDPVTRIEGHLRVDVEVDGGVVNKAWVKAGSLHSDSVESARLSMRLLR